VSGERDSALLEVPTAAEMGRPPHGARLTPALNFYYLPIGNRPAIVSGDVQFEDVFAIIRVGGVFLDYALSDIHLVQTVIGLRTAYSELAGRACLNCPAFVEHYYLAVEHSQVQKEAETIRNKYDKSSLVLMNEYSARMKFLRNNNFIEDAIALKGRMAAEIRTVNEVLVTELIVDNAFRGLDAPELISIFSSMVHEAREDGEHDVPERFVEAAGVLRGCYDRLAAEMEELGIPKMEPLNFEMLGSVYDWCQGASLGTVVSRHGVQEGTFVRLVLRLEECCREMVNVAALIGDDVLGGKFTEASQKIKRDIVFMPSLYI